MKTAAPQDGYIRLTKWIYPSGARPANNNPVPRPARGKTGCRADTGYPALLQHRMKISASVSIFPNAGRPFAGVGRVHFRVHFLIDPFYPLFYSFYDIYLLDY